MHSAEHVLTAVMRRDFLSSGNVEMHLAPKKSKCDYPVSRPLGGEDLESIERAVNVEIERDQAVSCRMIAREEASRSFDLSRIPEELTGIRIVFIGDLDETPCSGEHVERTGEIGKFKIRSSTMKADNVVRIRYGLEP